jgi:hydrogenase large subunit
MAVRKVVVDPITRIEGHLRIEVQAENGKISDAWATAAQFRGLELVMQGRDPRDAWAFTQRICGVCTGTHAIVSCKAVEDALGITIPPNAQLIRNLIEGVQQIHDHVVHFYHLHALDWVDVVSALKADPAEAAKIAGTLSTWPTNSTGNFKEVQARLQKFVGSGQLGIFANGYWGHPAYKLPPEVNLIAVAHYLEALDWQRDIVRLHAIFGGKNPHPNFLVGGMACAINLESTATINAERLSTVKSLLDTAQAFVEKVYWPDLLAIASFYPEAATYGSGTPNFLSYGDFPDVDVRDRKSYYFPSGVILDRDLSTVHEFDQKYIREHVHSSWFKDSTNADAGLHPWEGETDPAYDGPPEPWNLLQDRDKYSWAKAPRYKGKAMEVGPLARSLVQYASGHTDTKEVVDEALGRLKAPASALFSTLGRTAARGVDARLIAERNQHWYRLLTQRIAGGDTRTFDGSKWEPSTWPAKAEGVGLVEAPRGALGHWVQIENGKISRYQCVVPTTWNASPRDKNGVRGAFEDSLCGGGNHPLHDEAQPLELIRTIHSFDPCMACGVHVLDATGATVTEVKIQ